MKGKQITTMSVNVILIQQTLNLGNNLQNAIWQFLTHFIEVLVLLIANFMFFK